MLASDLFKRAVSERFDPLLLHICRISVLVIGNTAQSRAVCELDRPQKNFRKSPMECLVVQQGLNPPIEWT